MHGRDRLRSRAAVRPWPVASDGHRGSHRGAYRPRPALSAASPGSAQQSRRRGRLSPQGRGRLSRLGVTPTWCRKSGRVTRSVRWPGEPGAHARAAGAANAPALRVTLRVVANESPSSDQLGRLCRHRSGAPGVLGLPSGGHGRRHLFVHPGLEHGRHDDPKASSSSLTEPRWRGSPPLSWPVSHRRPGRPGHP